MMKIHCYQFNEDIVSRNRVLNEICETLVFSYQMCILNLHQVMAMDKYTSEFQVTL